MVCRSVGGCLLVKTVSPAKTAEQIEMVFRLWTQEGPRSHALDGAPILAQEWALLGGILGHFHVSHLPKIMNIFILTLSFGLRP